MVAHIELSLVCHFFSNLNNNNNNNNNHHHHHRHHDNNNNLDHFSRPQQRRQTFEPENCTAR